MVSASSGETTDHPDFLASSARNMKDAHFEEKLDEAYKVFDRGSSGYTDADKLRYVLLYMKKRANDEEDDQLKVAYVWAFEYVYWSDPAGHIMYFLVLYPLKHKRFFSRRIRASIV